MKAYVDTYSDNEVRKKALTPEYKDVYEDIEVYVYELKDEKMDKALVLSFVLSDLETAQKEKIDAKDKIPTSIATFIKKVVNKPGILKDEYKKLIFRDYEKYNVSSIWQVFMVFIVLMFLRNWLNDTYVIAYSIDIAIAVVALIVAVRTIQVKLRIMKKYEINQLYFRLDIITIIFCVFIKVLVNTNIDITFLVLVLEYLYANRNVKKEFEMIL